MSLDYSHDEFHRVLHKAADAVAEIYRKQDRAHVFHGKTPDNVRKLFDEELPRHPVDAGTLIERFESEVVPTSTMAINPNFYGYIVSAGSQIGVVAALLQIGANINNAKANMSSGAAEIERTVLRWIAEFIGYPADTGGVLISGGTMANLTCLHVARRIKAPRDMARSGLFDLRRMTLYASEEAHSSIEGSMDLMGMGGEQLRSIRTHSDFRIDCDAVEDWILSDIKEGHFPFCIVGTAGSTNTGAVDDLDRLAALAAKHGLWFHVDAAYGGPAARTTIAGDMFAGIEKADSVTVDPHKWLYLPVEMGCALVRNPEYLEKTFTLVPDYLEGGCTGENPIDWFRHTFHTTRDAKAVRAWMTFLAYGADAMRAEIENNIKSMRYLGRLLDEAPDFELLAPVPLSTVCFRYVPPGVDPSLLDDFNRMLLEAVENDGRVFVPGTRVNDKVAFRACTINHRHEKKHSERLIAIVRELAVRISVAVQAEGGPRSTGANSMNMARENLFGRFAELGIAAPTVPYPAHRTVEEGKALRGEMSGTFTKNLLLKDKKGRLFLVVAHEDGDVDLKTLHTRIGASGRLGFASADQMREVLDVEPGALTPLAMLNDPKNMVTAVIDASLMGAEQLNFHPLTNTQSTGIHPHDLLSFIASCGREAVISDLAYGDA